MGQGTAHEGPQDASHHQGGLGHAQGAAQFIGVGAVGNNGHGGGYKSIGKALEGPGCHKVILILAESAEKIGKSQKHRRPNGHFFLSAQIGQFSPDRTHDAGHQEAAGKHKSRPKGDFMIRHPQFPQVQGKKRNHHGVAGGNQEHTGYQGDDVFIVAQKQPSFHGK